jgi:hypothetical protein
MSKLLLSSREMPPSSPPNVALAACFTLDFFALRAAKELRA